MNHSKARQKTDGTWGYTNSNDSRGVTGVGYCRPFSEYSEDLIQNIWHGDRKRYDAHMAPYREAAAAGKFHDGGHATAEEAEECYKQYVLDFETRYREDAADPKQLDKCAADGCGAFTSGLVEVGSYIPKYHHLCAAHRNRETVSGMVKVGETWFS